MAASIRTFIIHGAGGPGYAADLSYIGTYAEDRQPTSTQLFLSLRAAGPNAVSSLPARSIRRIFPGPTNIFFRAPYFAAGTPRALLLVAADTERHPKRDGSNWATVRRAACSKRQPAARRF